MTPREKAKELMFLFANKIQKYDTILYQKKLSKKCALIAVDEIDLLIQNSTPKDDPYGNLFALEYWQEVKKEIEKL